MTEQVQEPTEAPVADKTPEFKDEFQRLAFNSIVEQTELLNSKISEYNAINGDVLDLREELTENSDNPEIIAAREARDEAINRLHALVTPIIEEKRSNVEGSLESLQAEIKELSSTVNAGSKYYTTLYGNETEFPKKKTLRGARVGNAGVGGKRIRGFNVVVKVDGDVEEFQNFSAAAKFLDVDNSVLQDKFFEVAGTDKSKDAPDKVSFTVEFTEVDEDENQTTKTADIYAYRPDTEADPNGADDE